MTTMRVLVLLLITWITWFAIGDHVRAEPRPLPLPRAAPPLTQLPTIASLDLDDPTYSTFITNIRDKVADKTLQCTIQKISNTLSQKYGYIDLIFEAPQKVTLAIDMADLYVLGYSDIVNGKDRAFFFKDVTDAVAKNFFPGATGANRIKLTFNGNYIDLEKYVTRENSPLGIYNLESSIINIYGKAADVKKQAKFLLLAIQMVSEAARFKYISDQIPHDKYQYVQVNTKMIALENGWASLSNAVYKSEPSKTTTRCQLATSPFILNPWTFATVEEIKQVVGLLKSSQTYTPTHKLHHYVGVVLSNQPFIF